MTRSRSVIYSLVSKYESLQKIDNQAEMSRGVSFAHNT